MISRRAFSAGALSALATSQISIAASQSPAAVFYASVGPELTLYDPDPENAALAKQGSVQLPANVQYVWPHPSSRWLYVVSSNGGPGILGDKHFATAGRYVYIANRGDATTVFQGQKVFLGGENNIAVFEIDANTGEPALIQHTDTHGFHARTFACDPSGRILVAANLEPRLVRDGDRVRLQPATIACYRIGADGKLTLVRTYDVETGGKMQFWSGFVALT